MKKILVFLLLVVFGVSGVYGQKKVGTSGASFLKIDVIPRSSGMGDAFVAVANGASSVFWNPAGIAFLKGKSLFASYTNWLVGSRVPALSYVWGAGRYGNLGFFIGGLQSGDFEEVVMDAQGNISVTGNTFSYNAFQSGISYSKFMTDKFVVGLNLKFIYEGFGEYSSAMSGAIDAGTMFFTGFKTLRIAMSIQNLGPDLKPSGNYPLYMLSGSKVETDSRSYRAYKLPMIFRLGAAIELLNSEDKRLTIAVEGANPNDNDETFALGAEFYWKKILFVRTGYTINKDTGGFGAGAGINTGSIQLDYSFSDFGVLPDIHRIGLSFSL